MEHFHNAKAVRLRSHHRKYLLADDDGERVSQDRQSTTKNARWAVEFDEHYDSVIRLKSCHGRYLTASEDPHILGVTGQKVVQSSPQKLDSSVDWEPVLEGSKVRLKKHGTRIIYEPTEEFHRGEIHDIPHRHHDWILWDVEVVEVSSIDMDLGEDLDLDSFDLTSNTKESHQKSGSLKTNEGRMIYYRMVDDDGDVVEAEGSFLFKGNTVEDLTRNLEEETELESITVCSRNPLNGNFYPLRLALPPNNTTMHVIVVPATSKAAKEF